MWILQKIRLNFRKHRLKRRIQALIRYCGPNESSELYIDLRDKLFEVERAINHINGDVETGNNQPTNPSLLLTDLDLYITNLERKCDKTFVDEEQGNIYQTHHSAKWLLRFSLIIWIFLMVTNWVSMCWPIGDCALINPVNTLVQEALSESKEDNDLEPIEVTNNEVMGGVDEFDQYQWSEGWFTSDLITIFALTGVAISILITLLPDYGRKAWDRTLLGTYAFRALQATIYAALVFQVVRSLPLLDKCHNILEFDICITQSRQAAILLVVSFLVGLFINRIEDVLIQILRPLNHQVDSRKLSSLRTDILELHDDYITLVPMLESDDERKYKEEQEHIEEEFETLLRLLRYHDYALCETKLCQLKLLIAQLKARVWIYESIQGDMI